MSYGRFEYANLTVDPPTVTTSGTVTVSVEVTNTAHRKADEVVQLYIHQRYGSVSRPVRELKGFRRLTLAAGESRTLHFPVGRNERRYWNAAARRMLGACAVLGEEFDTTVLARVCEHDAMQTANLLAEALSVASSPTRPTCRTGCASATPCCIRPATSS